MPLPVPFLFEENSFCFLVKSACISGWVESVGEGRTATAESHKHHHHQFHLHHQHYLGSVGESSSRGWGNDEFWVNNETGGVAGETSPGKDSPGSRKRRRSCGRFLVVFGTKFYQKRFHRTSHNTFSKIVLLFAHMFFNPLRREVSGFYQVGALLEDNPLIFCFAFLLLYYLVSCSLCIIILSFGGLYV